MKEKWVECSFLIPLRYNDGTKVEKSERMWLRRELFSKFNGWQIPWLRVPAETSHLRGVLSPEFVKGAYRMEDGKRQVDITQKYTIAIPVSKIPKLRQFLRICALRFKQESIYFVKSSNEVEFIGPAIKQKGASHDQRKNRAKEGTVGSR